MSNGWCIFCWPDLRSLWFCAMRLEDRMASRTLPISKRGLNFEMFMWAFTRFTVIAMYGLILAGLIGALSLSVRTGANVGDILYWAFFPNVAENPLEQVWMTIL